MVRVTVAEAKAQLSSLLDAVEAGQAVVITRRRNANACLRGWSTSLRAADVLHLVAPPCLAMKMWVMNLSWA
jgi:hypothetical protein